MNRCFLVTLSCVPRDDVEEVLDRLAQSFEMRLIHRTPNKKFKGTDNLVFFAGLRREEQEEASE